MCIVRGGGARTDLGRVRLRGHRPRHRDFPVPILTGIGHEIDTTVADLVAHRRCLTPTACAGALVDRVSAWCTRLHDRRRSIARAALRAVDTTTLDRMSTQLARRSPRVIEQATRDVDGVEQRVRALDPARALARGWSITRDGEGQLVRSTGEVAAGATLVTTVADGVVRSTVDG